MNGGLRRILPIPDSSGEGLLSDRLAGAQAWRRELPFMPLTDPRGHLTNGEAGGGKALFYPNVASAR